VESDAHLIERAAREPAALAELYRRHVRPIHRWLRARAPATVASELTAETFARAALSLHRFRDEADGSAAPWLHGIARNLLRAYYERERVETRARERLGMSIRSYDLDVDELGERLDAVEAKPALAAALHSLPARQREAVQLRVLEERQYADVAAELGITEVAARLRVMRALGSLARTLRGVDT
jgi:RNA polymerase sigma-70 factor (ECF subfamily)